MRQERVIELAEKHGATSYRNRADTANPAYGFTESQLFALIAEVEQAALERAAFECAFIAGLHKRSAKHEDRNDEFQRFIGAEGAAVECIEAIRNLAKEKPCAQPSSQQP